MNEFNETHKMMIMNYFCGMIGRQKALNLISAGIRVRDSHHCKSPTLQYFRMITSYRNFFNVARFPGFKNKKLKILLTLPHFHI